MMKLKFETVFRSGIFLAAAILLWGMWGNAQDTTNPVARISNLNKTEAILKFPAVIEQNKSLLTFGLDKIEALQPALWGNPRWQYLASLLYIILAFYAAKFLDFLTRIWLKKWAAKTATKLDDLLLEVLNGPIKIVAFIVFLHVGLSVFAWPRGVEEFLTKTLNLVVICAFTYVLLKTIDLLMGYWKQRVSTAEDGTFDEQLFPVIRKSLKFFIIVVALLFICQNVFQQDIKALLTSLSIGGLAIGLAAQDTLANVFGAVAVFVDKPFRIGDYIKLTDVEGTVETIGLRSTRVRNPEGHLITVPNKTMGNATITNIARRPTIRTLMNLGLTYDTSVDKVKSALLILDDVYKKHPMTHDVIISFNKFADSALNVQVVHFWKGTEQKAYLAGLQELNLAVKQRFDEAGIAFAFPTQTIHLKQDSEPQVGGRAGTGNTPH